MYEINQLSENKPATFINVVHTITNYNIDRLLDLTDELKIKKKSGPLNVVLNRMLSVTFQYKELNKDIYDLLQQDQVDTYIAY
jgi:hypothetical protein